MTAWPIIASTLLPFLLALCLDYRARKRGDETLPAWWEGD